MNRLRAILAFAAFAALVVAILTIILAPARAQSFEMGTALQTFASFGPQVATRTGRESLPVAPQGIRITASHQPSSTLRAVAKKMPEGAGYYAVRACNVSTAPTVVDPGMIEQAIEARGIALVPGSLELATLKRSRSRAFGALAKSGEVASIAGAVTGGIKILSESSNMSGWVPLALTGIGLGVSLIRSLASNAQAEIDAPVDEPRLSSAARMAINPGECSPRLLALGSWRKGQSETVVIE